ncbi:hypothetical protein ACN27G_27475 [Plantactinospora sp. WMMB334]|uniref:hypothetical protein n=1 Tax=Plantactinospora sp. WMMB334 TaxID=3404119 RepID=UPI003B963018
MTAAMIAPAWATRTNPEADDWTIHTSDPTDVVTDGPDGPGTFRIELSEEIENSQSKGVMIAMLNVGDWADLSPAHALDFAEQLRDLALTGAGPAGVDLPADRVRVGDELLTSNGWQLVETVDVDGWVETGHAHAVSLGTTVHNGDVGYRYPIGFPVRVRKAVTR